MKILIQNGKILLPTSDGFEIAEGSIMVDGTRISGIILKDEAAPARDQYDKIIDATDSLIMPGLINAHTHAYMSLFRNYADDMEFFDWLHSVEIVEDQLTSEDCYWASLLSIAEMIHTGTTCFVDMCLRSSQDGAKTGPKGAVSGAANESGIRAYIGRGLVGEAGEAGAMRRLNEFLADAKLHSGNDRVKFILAPHAPYSCEQSILKLTKETGLKEKMSATIHISESEAEMEIIAKSHHGITPVEYVANSGLFELPTIAAHLVNATDQDIELLKSQNVSVAINPRSNMKLGNGFAPVEKFLEQGLNICLGTDGSGSNNTQNMFQEMQAAALVYKGKTKQAKCVDAKDVVRFATTGGAKALSMGDELGIIKKGALADIILLDLNVPQFNPCNNLISALCYSANGSEVKTVIINGEIVMENRQILTFDEAEVYKKCESIASTYLPHSTTTY